MINEIVFRSLKEFQIRIPLSFHEFQWWKAYFPKFIHECYMN